MIRFPCYLAFICFYLLYQMQNSMSQFPFSDEGQRVHVFDATHVRSPACTYRSMSSAETTRLWLTSVYVVCISLDLWMRHALDLWAHGGHVAFVLTTLSMGYEFCTLHLQAVCVTFKARVLCISIMLCPRRYISRVSLSLCPAVSPERLKHCPCICQWNCPL